MATNSYLAQTWCDLLVASGPVPSSLTIQEGEHRETDLLSSLDLQGPDTVTEIRSRFLQGLLANVPSVWRQVDLSQSLAHVGLSRSN